MTPLFTTVGPLLGVNIGTFWGGLFIWLVPFVLPPLLIGLIILIVVRSTPKTHATVEREPDIDPLAVLEDRYTDGEIGFAEYERRLDQLFELNEDDHGTHPQIKQLAIRYARGEFDRDTLDRRVKQLQDDNLQVSQTDVDQFIETVLSADGSTVSVSVGQPADQQPAIQRLRRRYADGELSHEEYEQRLSVLRESDESTR